MNETIILLNEADLREGYFVFSTSRDTHFVRLCKRVGGAENLLEVKLSKRDGKVTWYSAKVPVKYLSRTHFGLRNFAVDKKKFLPLSQR